MIRIERKMTEKAQRAITSLGEAKRRNTTYNTPEVTAALREMFHGKCYICENRDITSWQIEHLRPHREEKNLKYDWDNLFLACAHCNNTKLAKYDPIIDCTKEDVEKLIAFIKSGPSKKLTNSPSFYSISGFPRRRPHPKTDCRTAPP